MSPAVAGTSTPCPPFFRFLFLPILAGSSSGKSTMPSCAIPARAAFLLPLPCSGFGGSRGGGLVSFSFALALLAAASLAACLAEEVDCGLKDVRQVSRAPVAICARGFVMPANSPTSLVQPCNYLRPCECKTCTGTCPADDDSHIPRPNCFRFTTG
jgi:hypothetical protein